VGGLLAIYNYERFGSVFEFGVTYCLNYFMGGDKPLFSAAYLWPNLRWYYLTAPSLSPYFPYVFPEQAYFGPAAYRGGETISGQLVVTLLAAFVAAAALLARKRLGARLPWAFVGILCWMFAAPLLAICMIGFRGNRYLVDCQPALVMAVVLAAGYIEGAALPGAAARLWRAGFRALALLAAAFNVLAGLQEFDTFKQLRAPSFRTLETLGNYPAYWLGKAGLLHYGPVELKVVFPPNPKVSVIEPLLCAGTPEYTDSLNVAEYAGGSQIEFVADHSTHGGPRSGAIPIEPGRTYTLRVDMGALYPPATAQFVADGDGGFSLRKSAIRVEMDGKVVLDRKMGSYDAPPWSVQAGRNHLTMNPFKTDFSGRILSVSRRPPRPLAEQTGLTRIRLELPVHTPDVNFPLLSSGGAGAGTMLYVRVQEDGRVRFGVDEWSIGGGLSDPVAPAPQPEHVVEVFVGSLASRALWPAGGVKSPAELGRIGSRLSVWMDGRLVWTTELKRPLDPLDPLFDLGTNKQGFSTAQPEYPVFFASEPYSRAEAEEFLARNLRAGAKAGAPK
jgi:hypothetical protein